MDARGMKGAWEGIVYYANHEKTDEDPRAGHARAVVRGSPADRSEVPQAEGAGRVGAGDRSRRRSRRLRPDHADRRQPAERSAHPREVRQQVGVARRTSSMPTSARCPTASARSSRGTTRRSERAQAVGRVCQRADDRDSRGARARLGPHGRSRHRDAAGSAEGAVLGARGDARRSRRAVFRRRSVSRRDRPGAAGRAAGRRADRVRGLRAQRAGAAAARPHRRAARRRSHAQPPGDRALAAGATPRRSTSARRDEKTYFVVVDTDAFRDGVARLLRRSAAHQVGRRLRGGQGSCSKPTACTSTPSCATRSSRASTT